MIKSSMSTQFFKNISNMSKIYKNSTLVLTVVSIGLLIMLLISGNLKQNNEFLDIDSNFECEQTPSEEIETLPSGQLKTDFEQASVDSKELVLTAQGKDSIPQINNPKFSKPSDIEKCLTASDIVVLIEFNNTVRLYPIKILQQHLIVNDVIADVPVLISYSILSGSPRAYIRVLDDKELRFGTTGALYKNNDLFYDLESDSLWRQFDGLSVAGDFNKSQLEKIPVRLISFSKAQSDFPDTEILNFDTGYKRFYDDIESFKTYEFDNKILAPVINQDNTIPPKSKVVGFTFEDQKFAIKIDSFTGTTQSTYATENYNFSIFVEDGIINIKSEDSQIDYSISYWYVWKDFYPETTLLNPS
jgi:hypothetical protein